MDSRVNEEGRQFVKNLLLRLGAIDYIEPGTFPDIDLYMDQVTTFMDNHLMHCKRHDDDKVLTKTMINNYAKNDLLPPPVKKKYTKDHMLFMVWIYYFKNLLSIGDVQTILKPLADYYFDKDGEKNLESVYCRVYELCKRNKNTYVRDLIKTYELVYTEFEDADMTDSPEEHDFIIKFCYLCALGYDMYMKKVAMEKIVDDMRKDMAKLEEKRAKEDAERERRGKQAAEAAKEAAREARRVKKKKE